MTRPAVNPGALTWSGEHWICYIRRPGESTDSGMVSLYHTRYSAAGEGTVAFVTIPEAGCNAIYTDNPDVASFMLELSIRGKGGPFDREMPLRQASLSRAGDIRYAPSWVIEAGDQTITAAWKELHPPVIAEGPAPTFSPFYDFFTLLFFAEQASIRVNDVDIPGEPYLRDIWKKSIGGDRSSCVFALAESMTRVPER